MAMKTKFGSSLPQSERIQKSVRTDPFSHIPFAEDSPPDNKLSWYCYGFILFLCFLIGVFS